jgi:hypothetical protein
MLQQVMPTVLRIGGLRVAIYPNDHPPPHVHVIGPSGEAVLLINCPHGPVSLRENYGFKASAIRTMAMDLLAHVPALCGEWRRIHGNL